MSATQTTVLPLSLPTLHSILKHAPAKYLNALNAAMTRYEINTPKRVAAYLSQLAVESGELRHTHELWTSKANFHLSGVNRPAFTATSKKAYFEHWYGKRPEGLGNLTAEDGYTYRGRGAIQITGKANYKSIGEAIGKPLVTNPDLVESDVAVDMLASAYFFARLKHLNHVADGVDPSKPASIVSVNTQLTHAVNGHQNGINERLHYFKKGLALLVH